MIKAVILVFEISVLVLLGFLSSEVYMLRKSVAEAGDYCLQAEVFAAAAEVPPAQDAPAPEPPPEESPALPDAAPDQL